MSSTNEGAVAFVRLLARLTEQLIAFAAALRAREGVVSVTRGLEFRHYETGPVVECFLDAELQDGSARCWWIDCQPVETGWVVEASVRRVDAEGQERILALPSRQPPTLEELGEALDLVVAELFHPELASGA
jgi:hypothetical protein